MPRERSKMQKERHLEKGKSVPEIGQSESELTIFLKEELHHRINLTLYKLDKILLGESLNEIIDALLAEEQAQKLADGQS